MVIIDGEKYACERCIRGHRVSSCNHVDSPLVHIKPKGRPATQCQYCREARRQLNTHSKCSCGRSEGDCRCQQTSKCECSVRAKARVIPAPQEEPNGGPTTVNIKPEAVEEGIEIELGIIDENARYSPFQTWYPRTADAYNALPTVVPTFGFEDETAPLSIAREFVLRNCPPSTEVWYEQMQQERNNSRVPPPQMPEKIQVSDPMGPPGPQHPSSWYKS